MAAKKMGQRKPQPDMDDGLLRLPLNQEALKLIKDFNEYSAFHRKAFRHSGKNEREIDRAGLRFVKQALKVAKGIIARTQQNGGLLSIEDLATMTVLRYCDHMHGPNQALQNELVCHTKFEVETALLASAGLKSVSLAKRSRYGELRRRSSGKEAGMSSGMNRIQ